MAVRHARCCSSNQGNALKDDCHLKRLSCNKGWLEVEWCVEITLESIINYSPVWPLAQSEKAFNYRRHCKLEFEEIL